MNDAIIAEARRISARIKPSRKWEHVKKYDAALVPWSGGGHIECEFWRNELYEVTVRRFPTGWPLNNGPWTQIGIHCPDGEARHDWRDFQCIKNDTVGLHWEAIELYPDETRLLDPSNYYILFAAPKIPIGVFQPRSVMDIHECIAPQRGWKK